MRILVIASLFAAAAVGCKAHRSDSNLRVVGGLEDGRQIYPDAVGLERADGRIVCTGTVIGKRSVLTAAHCISKDTPLRVSGVSESATLVARAYRDEDLGVGDLAILQFTDAFTITPRALSFAQHARGTTITIVGFGCDGSGSASSGKRRYGDNALRSIDPEGPLVYVREDEDGDPVPGKNVSSCAGDSGGPVLVEGGVSAVTSGNDGRYNFATWIGSKPGLALLRVAAASDPTILNVPGGPATAADREAVERLDR